MPMHVYYTCKKCEHEMEVDVVINEEDDLPEACPECGEKIPERAHEEVHERAMEKASEPRDNER